jgi:transposase
LSKEDRIHFFIGGHVNTSSNAFPDRRRRRTHSTEFKAKVVAGCRKPGVSIAAVALDYRLNANLVRRWIVADEQTSSAKPIDTAIASPAPITVENRAFIPIQMERAAVTPPQERTTHYNHGRPHCVRAWGAGSAAET